MRGVNVDASGQPQLTGNDVFGFGLDYETAGQYDGNIGKQRWLANQQPAVTRQYSYQYDEAKRLSGAAYTGAGGENYSLSGMSYDANGNILSLNRANIDQLTYQYGAGNSLLSVSDGSGNLAGFADGNTSGDDYAHWPDGSIKKDLNRGISDIQYNLLKLPRQVTFTSGKIVRYQYDAEGTKLNMSVLDGEVRDYIGPFQYLTPGGGSRSRFEISTEEGRYTSAGGYAYYHRDHLGNVRAVQGQGGVSQWTDYDPWGLELAGLSSGSNTSRARFNGKEAIAEIGANFLDFGARGYDATIGRMHQVDALADAFAEISPFSFGLNNPVMNIDPTGDSTVPASQWNMSSFGHQNNGGGDLGDPKPAPKTNLPFGIQLNVTAAITMRTLALEGKVAGFDIGVEASTEEYDLIGFRDNAFFVGGRQNGRGDDMSRSVLKGALGLIGVENKTDFINGSSQGNRTSVELLGANGKSLQGNMEGVSIGAGFKAGFMIGIDAKVELKKNFSNSPSPNVRLDVTKPAMIQSQTGLLSLPNQQTWTPVSPQNAKSIANFISKIR